MPDLAERAAKIELLVLDVDGVLTDGSIVYADDGAELKRFHVRDGSGLKLWHLAGKRSAIVSGRKSAAVERRAAELGIAAVLQTQAAKVTALGVILNDTGLQADQVCAIGDDLPDLPLLRKVGIAIATVDACQEVSDAADYVTKLPGGRGAVRDAIEWLLKRQGRWQEVLNRFAG
jgi:3-deoxy-D-manno-octulosonate 8-phosphate phosphatase (KDO 8-P phosphatase)